MGSSTIEWHVVLLNSHKSRSITSNCSTIDYLICEIYQSIKQIQLDEIYWKGRLNTTQNGSTLRTDHQVHYQLDHRIAAFIFYIYFYKLRKKMERSCTRVDVIQLTHDVYSQALSIYDLVYNMFHCTTRSQIKLYLFDLIVFVSVELNVYYACFPRMPFTSPFSLLNNDLWFLMRVCCGNILLSQPQRTFIDKNVLWIIWQVNETICGIYLLRERQPSCTGKYSNATKVNVSILRGVQLQHSFSWRPVTKRKNFHLYPNWDDPKSMLFYGNACKFTTKWWRMWFGFAPNEMHTDDRKRRDILHEMKTLKQFVAFMLALNLFE